MICLLCSTYERTLCVHAVAVRTFPERILVLWIVGWKVEGITKYVRNGRSVVGQPCGATKDQFTDQHGMAMFRYGRSVRGDEFPSGAIYDF